MGGVIDLGQYLRVLLRWWWVVLLGALIGALLGLAWRLTSPTVYTSEAILLVRPPLPAVTVDVGPDSGSRDPLVRSLLIPDLPVRSLATVAESPEIAARANELLAQRLGERFPARLRGAQNLRGHIAAREVSGQPGLLAITATDPDRTLATEVANVWATVAAEYLNAELDPAYIPPSAAAEELRAAEAEWDRMQAVLSAFERDGELPALAAALASGEALLNDYLEQRNQIALKSNDAALLAAQLEGGGAPPASALAVQILALSTFTSQAANVDVSRFLPPVQTRADAPDTARAAEREDSESGAIRVEPVLGELVALPVGEQARFVRQLRTALERRQAALQTSIGQLEGRIGDLRARMEEQMAARARLVLRRDAARGAYEALTTRLRQQDAAGRARGDKITVTNTAAGARRAGAGRLLPPLLGALAGTGAGILAAFLLEFARRPRETRVRGTLRSAQR